MPYIFVAMLTAGFVSGYGVCYQVSKAEIQHMSDGIAAQNREAELTLATLTEQADRAHTEALKANKEMEDSNATAIKIINTQRDNLKSIRMYDPGRKSSGCTVSPNTNTSIVNDSSANDGKLSNELAEFLKSEAYRSDEISNYAMICQKFIKGWPQ